MQRISLACRTRHTLFNVITYFILVIQKLGEPLWEARASWMENHVEMVTHVELRLCQPIVIKSCVARMKLWPTGPT